MKYVITALLFIFFMNANSQTTEEEYRYLTKGYKIQLESGLDMKKGYRIEDVDTWGLRYENFYRNTSFKFLYRDNDSIPCATLMILERTDNGYSKYLCIPHEKSSDEIWNKFYTDFFADEKDWSKSSKGYEWGMIKMISHLASRGLPSNDN